MIFTTLVGSAGIVMPFFKRWDTKAWRPVRVSVFLAMAFSSIVPVLHLVCRNGFVRSLGFFHLALISVVMYLCGVVVCKLTVGRGGEKKLGMKKLPLGVYWLKINSTYRCKALS